MRFVSELKKIESIHSSISKLSEFDKKRYVDFKSNPEISHYLDLLGLIVEMKVKQPDSANSGVGFELSNIAGQ